MKICPLLLTSILGRSSLEEIQRLIGKSEEMQTSCSCIGEKCAWWNGKEKQCIVCMVSKNDPHGYVDYMKNRLKCFQSILEQVGQEED